METFPNFSTLRIALLFSVATPSFLISPLPSASPPPPVYSKCYSVWKRNYIYRLSNLCYWVGSRWGRSFCMYPDPWENKKWQIHFCFSHSCVSSLIRWLNLPMDRPGHSLLLSCLFRKGRFEFQGPFLSDSLFPWFLPSRNTCQEFLNGGRKPVVI